MFDWQELENRLFSEGLHILGEAPSPPRMQQFLEAYFDGSMPEAAVEAVSQGSDGLTAVKERLERSLDLVHLFVSESSRTCMDSADTTEALLSGAHVSYACWLHVLVNMAKYEGRSDLTIAEEHISS